MFYDSDSENQNGFGYVDFLDLGLMDYSDDEDYTGEQIIGNLGDPFEEEKITLADYQTLAAF
ncbi:MAG: hypothetical protein GY915_04090 [bacterium]|nr:hypothetical protein [bacterium]